MGLTVSVSLTRLSTLVGSAGPASWLALIVSRFPLGVLMVGPLGRGAAAPSRGSAASLNRTRVPVEVVIVRLPSAPR